MTPTSRFLLPRTLATLMALPVLSGLMLLQTSLVSRFVLLQGTSDLVLLAIIAWALQKRVESAWQWGLIGGLIYSIASALPIGASFAGYLPAVALALTLRRRVWRVPLLAMFVTTLFGTLFFHAISYLTLIIVRDPLPLVEAFNLITLPSLVLNLLLAIPVYALISDLARWLYPEVLEV